MKTNIDFFSWVIERVLVNFFDGFGLSVILKQRYQSLILLAGLKAEKIKN